MQHCYNRGCGQMFDPANNNDDSCCHHPGAPFFHDVYKGWSCCNKKSVDFTDFLNIKGCTISKHSNVKPPEPEKPAKDSNDTDSDVVVEVRKPINTKTVRPPFAAPMKTIKPIVEDSVKQAIDALANATITPASTNKILAEGEVPIGTSCKNSGCSYSFTGTAADNEECTFHPGVPIFHEGMKYWSCCQKKTTDFAVFMSQKGCVYGQHKWFKENNKDKKVVQCRYDWHQTAVNVIVSIYAKKCHYAESLIEVNPIRLHVNLVFPEQDNSKFDLDMELRGIIDVEQTTVHMFGTKVEITMRKAEPGSWAKLDYPQQQKTSSEEQKTNQGEKTKNDSESDDAIDLDDIEPVKPGGLSLTEISTPQKNDLD